MSDDAVPSEFLHGDITGQIIGAAFEVHRVLGYGFLERVYQRALQVELERNGRKVIVEHDIGVLYKGFDVGHYRADLLVDDLVVVELKVSKEYSSLDEAQLLNLLKATRLQVGLLINFGRNRSEVS